MRNTGWIMVWCSAALCLAAAGIVIHLGWCTWYAGWDEGLSDAVEALGRQTMWAGVLPLLAGGLVVVGASLIARNKEK
jgi:TRAP-type C4-dicarboxylate transport system permease small subunit